MYRQTWNRLNYHSQEGAAICCCRRRLTTTMTDMQEMAVAARMIQRYGNFRETTLLRNIGPGCVLASSGAGLQLRAEVANEARLIDRRLSCSRWICPERYNLKTEENIVSNIMPSHHRSDNIQQPIYMHLFNWNVDQKSRENHATVERRLRYYCFAISVLGAWSDTWAHSARATVVDSRATFVALVWVFARVLTNKKKQSAIVEIDGSVPAFRCARDPRFSFNNCKRKSLVWLISHVKQLMFHWISTR